MSSRLPIRDVNTAVESRGTRRRLVFSPQGFRPIGISSQNIVVKAKLLSCCLCKLAVGGVERPTDICFWNWRGRAVYPSRHDGLRLERIPFMPLLVKSSKGLVFILVLLLSASNAPIFIRLPHVETKNKHTNGSL